MSDLVERVRQRLADGRAELSSASVAAAVRGEAGGVVSDEDV
ncbi:MAG: ATPase, partial [Saccharothrix sp.]|nr:ATPase [Saccharothrix sp.]